MSYIADQLRGIGLIINYKTETPENESGYKVSIQFALNGRTNYISITDSQLTKIYRILSKGEKLHSNRGRGLRRNQNKNFAYHLAMESTERVKALVKEARRVKYKVRGSVADGIVEIISDDVPPEYVLTATKAPYGWSVRYNKEFWQG